jgi:hypothetical protein
MMNEVISWPLLPISYFHMNTATAMEVRVITYYGTQM